MLSKEPTDINHSASVVEKKFSINFSKAKTKFCHSFHYKGDANYLLINRKEICNFKADNKNVQFPTLFCLWRISGKFDAAESIRVLFMQNMFDFSDDYNAIDK